MGFLDNTTNNIILDAVLTDTGRQFLSRNDGSFSMFKFALGDDEVNYGLIKKYGRSVGGEKIQKNTPIFEALTDQSNALKYKLISVSNPNLVYLPKLKLDTPQSFYQINLNGRQNFANISVIQANGTGPSIDPELQDVMFVVEMNDMFLQVQNGASNLQSVDANQRAVYKFTNTGIDTNEGGSRLQLTVIPRVLTTEMFTIYGQNNIITTYVKIMGMQSGASIDIPVYISLA